MGTTLSLIFRRLATKFSNLVQKKNPPGPAGPALAGPLFSGSLASFPDCRDSLRTRRLGQVSHVGLPFPCEYAFLVIVPALLPADQEPGAARPDCRDRHPRVAKYTCDVQLLEIWLSLLLAVDPLPYTSDLLFAVA